MYMQQAQICTSFQSVILNYNFHDYLLAILNLAMCLFLVSIAHMKLFLWERDQDCAMSVQYQYKGHPTAQVVHQLTTAYPDQDYILQNYSSVRK